MLLGSVPVQVPPTNPRRSELRETNQCAIDEMFSKVIRVKMNEKTLENAWLELVAINGRPFKLINDSWFRKVLNPMLKVCKPNLPSLQKISTEKIGEKANDVCCRIKLKVEGKLVSLKADVATCRDRSILDVNLQFISDRKITHFSNERNNENHSGFYLKTVLDEIIEQYRIESNQIYSLTADNGANMLKCVRLFSEGDVTEKTANVEQPSCSSRATQKNSLVMKTIAVPLIA